MSRRTIIAGNWKMQPRLNEALSLVRELKQLVSDVSGREIIVAPQAPLLPIIINELKDSKIAVAAQNCHFEERGAFTGEWQTELLADIGCRFVIVGHSERRKYFGETSELVAKKAAAVLRAGLEPIVCVGETLQEREAGRTFEVVRSQLEPVLSTLAASEFERLIIAYEPVWAIGTGKTASPQQAQEVHEFIRNQLRDAAKEVGVNVPILYGGSVKPENIDALMSMSDIDGVLVGGASLKAESFARIVKFRA